MFATRNFKLQRPHGLHAGWRPLPQGKVRFEVFWRSRHNHFRLASAVTGFESDREFVVNYQIKKVEKIRFTEHQKWAHFTSFRNLGGNKWGIKK